MKGPLDWLRKPVSDRDAVGETLPPAPPAGEHYFRWMRWRGTVNRIADLALLCGEILGTQALVIVTWSDDFARAYAPGELQERVEEDRLARAEVVEISAVGGPAEASVRLCGYNGEPGADLTVWGATDAVAKRLRGAVELGEWRPWSADRLSRVTGFVVAALTLVVAFSLFESSVTGPVGSVIFSVLPTLYFALASAGVRKIMPPLEIRPAGSTAARGILAWFFPGLPALVAIAGLVIAIKK